MNEKVSPPKTLPRYLKRYFWEVDFAQVQLPEREFYVIERLLEHGDDKAIGWLRETFTDETLGSVVRRSRAISAPKAIFWSELLGIPRTEIRMLTVPTLLSKGAFSNWQYLDPQVLQELDAADHEQQKP